ncbi:MAG: hypothetical protein MUO77_10140 [Anaerolineales bacterium]|nr:hypothetical protein [Anaerolineales bacterium]
MNRLPAEQEKRLFQLKQEVTKRGFDRHASILKDTTELPPELQSSAVIKVTSDIAIETIILFPPQLHRGWDYIPKQALLFTSTGMIHLLASIWPDQEPRLTSIKGHDFIYMNVKLLLLYGLLEIVACGQTSPVRLGMEFNTVAWYKLSEPLRKLLQSTRPKPDISPDDVDCSPDVQQTFAELPLKFSNGVKIYGLLPGEQLVDLVFQPGVWKRWLHFSRQPVIANTLLMLTSNYMVIIREELKVSQGWVLTYIPRACIAEMQCGPGVNTHDELIVKLERGDQKADYKISLNSEYVEAWHLLWSRHGDSCTNLSI